MSKVVERDYGVKVKRTKEAKEEASLLFQRLADRLKLAIDNNEVDHLSKLAATRTTDPKAFFATLQQMMN